MTTALQTRQTQLETFRTTAQAVTMADPNVAAQRPLSDIVRSTLSAAGSRSSHTARAYTTGIGIVPAMAGDGTVRPGPGRLGTVGEHLRLRGGERSGPSRTVRPPSSGWLTLGALDNFVAYRLAAGDTTGTADNRLAAVRTFLSVAYRDKVLSRDQGEGLGLKPYRSKRQRDEQPVGRRLTVQEVRQLRQAVDVETNKGKRDRAILDCMLFAGLRRSEVAGLMASDITQDQGRYWLRLMGKGRKTRRVKVHDTLYQSLAAWLAVARSTSTTTAPSSCPSTGATTSREHRSATM